MEAVRAIRWLCVMLFVLCGVGATPSSVAAGLAVENDDCLAATPIGDGNYDGTTTGATPDGTDSCDGSGAGDLYFLG